MSDARQLLRDYAREEVTTTIPDNASGDYELVVGQRGELAGLTFQALQAVIADRETPPRTLRIIATALETS